MHVERTKHDYIRFYRYRINVYHHPNSNKYKPAKRTTTLLTDTRRGTWQKKYGAQDVRCRWQGMKSDQNQMFQLNTNCFSHRNHSHPFHLCVFVSLRSKCLVGCRAGVVILLWWNIFNTPEQKSVAIKLLLNN